MKLYIIPNPYDYHEQGEILVWAENEEEAKLKAKSKVGEYNKLKLDEIEEFTDDYYINKGCDC